MGKLAKRILTMALLICPIAAGGCFPFSMGIFTPVPIQPWVAERMEEKYCYPNDSRTPIMPPIKPGFPPPMCEDPPDKAFILRKMPRITRGIPYVYEEFRDDYETATELVSDKIDPVRMFPNIGPAQLHHCHWKCTIYYTETIQSDWPFPYRCKKPRIEVLYIDKDHLHLYAGNDPDLQKSYTHDLTGH